MEVERIKMPGKRKREDWSYIGVERKMCDQTGSDQFCTSWHKVRGAGNKESWKRYLDPKYMEEEVKEKQQKNGSQMRRSNIRAVWGIQQKSGYQESWVRIREELHKELSGKPGVGQRSLQRFGQSGRRGRMMWHVSLLLSIPQLVQKPLWSISKGGSTKNISMLLYGRFDLFAEARLLPNLSPVRIWLVGCCPGCCFRIQQWFLKTAAVIRHNLRILGSFSSEHPSIWRLMPGPRRYFNNLSKKQTDFWKQADLLWKSLCRRILPEEHSLINACCCGLQ